MKGAANMKRAFNIRRFACIAAATAAVLIQCALCFAEDGGEKDLKKDVVVANRSAGKYVALTFDDQYKAGIDDRLRKIVRERIDGVIGGIDTVALTTDKTVMDALEALQDRMDSVSDMSSLQAELDKILETMNAASRAKA